MRRRSTGEKGFAVFNGIFLVITALICLLPFVNTFAISLSSRGAVAANRVFLWPVDFTIENYRFAFEQKFFLTSFWMSIQRTVLGVGINMFLILLVAYPLSKDNRSFKGRNVYMVYFLITMFLNGGMIPTYLVIAKLKLMDSIWPLVLIGALPVYNMLIMMNFIRSLPREIEEAALIDGAGPWQVLWQIIVPISKPAIATVSLFCIVHHWNSWFDGMIYIKTQARYPLQTYLQKLMTTMEEMLRAAQTDSRLLLNLINARSGRSAQLFMGAIPVMVVYPFLQKYFTTGLVLGSVKG